MELHDIIKGIVRGGNCTDSIKNALWDLHAVLIEHFFNEEYAIRQLRSDEYGYYIDQHIRAHDHILDTIERVCSMITLNDKDTIKKYLPGMITMLLECMMSDDNRIIEYLSDEEIRLKPSDVYPCE